MISLYDLVDIENNTTLHGNLLRLSSSGLIAREGRVLVFALSDDRARKKFELIYLQPPCSVDEIGNIEVYNIVAGDNIRINLYN